MTDDADRAEAIIEYTIWQLQPSLSHDEAHVLARTVLAVLRDAGWVVVAQVDCEKQRLRAERAEAERDDTRAARDQFAGMLRNLTQ